MNYKSLVLRDQPIAFYLFDESSGLVAQDSSGYARNAIYSSGVENGTFPLVSGTLNGTKLLLDQWIQYPKLPIWDFNFNSFEFAIEFWLLELDLTSEQMTIFAPFDSDGIIKGAGIYYLDGKITFAVSNGTGMLAPSNIFSVSYEILDRSIAHHFVCQFHSKTLSIFEDGVMVATQDQIFSQDRWIHHLDHFKTQVPSTGSFVIDSVAVYQNSLPTESIQSHYLIGNHTRGALGIVSKNKGLLFPIEDSGYIKNFDKSLPSSGWKTFITENLTESPDKLSLIKIEPPELNGVEVYDSGLSLQTGQYLTISDFKSSIGNLRGGIGGAFYFSETKHNNNQEYCLFSISSGSDVICVIQLNNKLTIRHKYFDTGTNSYITVDTIGSQIVYDEWANILLVWSEGLYTLYYNSSLDHIQYDDSSSKHFSLKLSSSILVGSTDAYGSFFESKVKSFSIYNSIPSLDNFPSLLTNVGNFMIKLISNKNVYQKGYAKFHFVLSGLEKIKETRIDWGPDNLNVEVGMSPDNIIYSLCENGAYLPGTSNGDNLGEILPNCYLRVELSTQDSYFDVTELRYLKISAYSDTTVRNFQSGITMSPYGKFHTGSKSLPVLSNYKKNGISFKENGYSIISSPLSGEHSLSDGRILPASAPIPVKTIEMFIKKNQSIINSSLYFYNKSDEEKYSLFSAMSPGGMKTYISGFSNIFINGVIKSANYVFPHNQWAHVILTTNGLSGKNRVNLVTNPRLSLNTDGWISKLESNSERTQEVKPVSGDFCYKMTSNSISTDKYGFELKSPTGHFPAAPSKNYSASIYLMTKDISRNASISISFYNSNGDLLSSSISQTFEDYQSWSLFSVKGLSPLETTSIGIDVYYGPGLSQDEIHYACNPLLEESSILWPYFDGSTEGARWASLEDQSSSIFNIGLSMNNINNSTISLGSYSSFSSFTNLSLYPLVFTEAMALENYNSYLGRLFESIAGNTPGTEEIDHSPPKAISAPWNIYTGNG